MRTDAATTLGRGRRPRGWLKSILGLIVLCLVLLYGVAAVTSPWSFHIGGRWTPLLYWSGSGRLGTNGGAYPVHVFFYPSSHFSRLWLDGRRPTGGVQGWAYVCTSRGVMERFEVSGTIYGGWSSTDHSLMAFRFLAPHKIIRSGEYRDYFDLYGRWVGPELVMDNRGQAGSAHLNGAKMEPASLTLDRASYWDFRASCASANSAP